MSRLNLSILSGGIFLLAGLRFLMAPYPNVEPIMLFVISTALVFGPLAGFILGFGSMIVSDMFLGLYGPWTLYTAPTYGLIGLIVGFIGTSKNKWGRPELTALAFVMTIAYDIITATFWALQTLQPLIVVYVTQIPFTLLHLSNCVFVFLFAPYLMRVLSVARDFSIVRFLRDCRVHT